MLAVKTTTLCDDTDDILKSLFTNESAKLAQILHLQRYCMTNKKHVGSLVIFLGHVNTTVLQVTKRRFAFSKHPHLLKIYTTVL